MTRLMGWYGTIVDETMGSIKVTKKAGWVIIGVSYLIEICHILTLFSSFNYSRGVHVLTLSFDKYVWDYYSFKHYLLMICRPGSLAVYKGGLNAINLTIWTCIILSTVFIVLVSCVWIKIGLQLKTSTSTGIGEKAYVKFTGFVVLLLIKGVIMVVLDTLMSPLLCLPSRKVRGFCLIGDTELWVLVGFGAIFSFLIITVILNVIPFTATDCLVKTNYLSTASSSCDLFDFFTKVVIVVLGIFQEEIPKSVLGGVRAYHL